MSEKISVKKRNGSIEPLQLEKIHRMVSEACDGISGVSVSQVEMSSGLQFYDGISTEDIQEILIKSAADLISLDHPGYQYVAARLLLFSLRKKIYGGRIDLPALEDQIKRGVELGVYDGEFIHKYDKDELNKLDSYIDHSRDYIFSYAGLRQVVDKYLVQDRSANKIYETPQFMYMLIAMIIFVEYPKDTRLSYVKRYYDAISKHKINIPTPIIAGVRTPLRQFSSCVLVDVGDSLDSIFSSDMAIGRYVSQRAGIGINAGRIRGINSKIRGGEVQHTGVIPFLKKFESTVRCCTQNGIRGGSATVHFAVWHQEIEDIIVLKNNKGTEDNRVRKLDYSIQISKLFYERFISDGVITLFSPHDVPGLYDVFGMPEFDDLYVKYENDPTIPKKQVKAQELLLNLLKERAETGRIYIMNIDHANTHSAFKDQVNMSNLCVAPETQILTRDGYQTISELEDEFVDIWNGQEWSNVQVKKTSECQELLKVVIDGEYIECTPYHRFFVMDPTSIYARNKRIIEKRAHELQPGDKLIRYELPVIEGEKELEHAYTLGFHTGDGSYSRGKPILDLYGAKKAVLEHLNYSRYYGDANNNRIRTYLDIPPHTKFVVPGCEHTIESRLKWFAGLIDSDGHIAKNGNTETIQVNSIHFDFLREVKYMLQTLGVTAKITNGVEAGMRLMPDGHGGQKKYDCKKSWRLLISNTGLARLCNLDFHTYTKKSNIGRNVPNRNAERFNVVEEIIYTGRFDATYCFTEHKRGMGMFNGFLLGNCQEILLPTTPLKHIDDNEHSEIATCILSAINVGKLKSTDELEELCDLSVRSLDELIDYQHYPVKAAENFTKNRRALGIGYLGLAHYFAKHGCKYDSQEAWDLTHKLTESFQYYLLKASNQLAIEKGACAYFNKTKYSEGILPIDTYKKEVDTISLLPYEHDWDELRESIKKHGLRHSTLSAQPPTESSSVSLNATNGIEPPRDYLSVKQSKKGPLKQIVPQYQTLKNNYTLLWDMQNNTGYINVAAVIQKFFDQGISGNWSYNPEHYENNEVPVSEMARDMLYSYFSGWKTSYYQNTYDSKSDEMIEDKPKENKSLVDEILASDDGICESCSV